MFRKIIERLAKIVNPWEEYTFDKREISFGEKLRRLFKKIYLWSQRTYAIRYIPALNEINSHPETYNTILEVGSGALGLSRYIKRKIVGVDINTIGPHYKNMVMVGSSAALLPFKDDSFDIVVSLDMLEHIPLALRQAVVYELMRVAKKKVIFGVPSFDTAKKLEDKVRIIYESKLKHWRHSRFSKEKFIKRNIFLFEHEKYGLPKTEEINSYINEYIKNSSRNYKVKTLDNENISVWYYGVLGEMKYSYLRWFLTAVLFVLFFSILSRLNFGRCYRKIFIIDKGCVK